MSQTTKTTVRQRLRARLNSGPMIVAPGIYDAFGARFVEQQGFEAVYMTGNGVSASLLGRPDVGLIDLTLIASHAHRVASCVGIPLICDADTGYGNAVNVRRTVEEFEAAGVAAIHVEDQVAPKRCGHLPGSRSVVTMEEHIGKIEAACGARRDADFIIIARTDAASGHGLDEAIRRGNAYRKAGADVVFVELKTSPTVLEDMKRITTEIDAPCLVNIDGGGKLGELTVPGIERLGFRIAIFPGLERYAAGFAIREALVALKRDGNTSAVRDRMLTMQEYNDALGLPEVEEWENKYLLSREPVPAQPLKLYDRERSGNCYKARLMLSLLDLEYEKVPVHREGKGRNILPPDLEKLNPLRQLPILIADGKPYWGTITILVYLARIYGGTAWLPDDAAGEAEVTPWLSLAENEIFYGFGRARSVRAGRWHGHGTLEQAHQIAHVALRVLEGRLAGHDWLALDRVTVADIACYSYTVFAPEGGISLQPFPGVRAWLARVEALPGYLPIPAYDGAGGPSVP